MAQPSKHTRLQTFASLSWYEETIKFIFNFTAKTSELLLATGLVVSTANFLTDGAVMGSNTALADAWAWAQALAIDSSLGVTFLSVFQSIKQRDWIKAIFYGLLTLLLAVVAGTITNIDTFSHAIHQSIAVATTQVGLNVKLLTTLRAIAVVGFVMMSRLKHVSFKELYQVPETRASLASPAEAMEESKTSSDATPPADMLRESLATLPLQERIRLIQAVLHVNEAETVITEEQATPQQLAHPSPTEQEHHPAPPGIPHREGRNASQEETRDSVTHEDDAGSEDERERRLQQAYAALITEGQRVSGRALAARTHIRRTTCTQWLERIQQQTLPQDQSQA